MRDARRIRCPRCGKRPEVYKEFYEGMGTEFSAGEDGVPEPEGWHFEGLPCRVEATCRCGFQWRLRGVAQITDLRPS